MGEVGGVDVRQKGLKRLLLSLVGIAVDGDRGLGHHLFHHPDGGVEAQGDRDRIAGAGVKLPAQFTLA